MILAAGLHAAIVHAPQENPLEAARIAAATSAPGRIWAISFVRARPGQRERLERFLRANWLALDELALREGRISAYRLLRADADPREASWDYAVVIEYADREAMSDFVPFYLKLARERPHVRVDGLDFADLGSVVEQKIVEPLAAGATVEAGGRVEAAATAAPAPAPEAAHD